MKTTGAPNGNGAERSLTASKEKLNRLLIEQFYEASVHRYGSDSQQAEMLSRLLEGSEKAIL
jgi:hypothetical protein